MMRNVFISLAQIAAAAIILSSPSESTAQVLPEGWYSYSPARGEFNSYRSSDVKRTGEASGAIERISGNKGNFETLMQSIDAREYAGKKMRLSAWIKTQDAGAAQLWLRIDNASRTLAMDNMDSRQIKGTSEWAEYEIIMDFPVESVRLSYGLLLQDFGKAWIDDISLQPYSGAKNATTIYFYNETSGSKVLPSARKLELFPQNLGFENK